MKILLSLGFLLLLSCLSFSQAPQSAAAQKPVSPVTWEERQWPKLGLLEIRLNSQDVAFPGEGVYYPSSGFIGNSAVPEWIRKIGVSVDPKPTQIQVDARVIRILVQPRQLRLATKLIRPIVVSLFPNQQVSISRMSCWERKVNDVFLTNCPP